MCVCVCERARFWTCWRTNDLERCTSTRLDWIHRHPIEWHNMTKRREIWEIEFKKKKKNVKCTVYYDMIWKCHIISLDRLAASMHENFNSSIRLTPIDVMTINRMEIVQSTLSTQSIDSFIYSNHVLPKKRSTLHESKWINSDRRRFFFFIPSIVLNVRSYEVKAGWFRHHNLCILRAYVCVCASRRELSACNTDCCDECELCMRLTYFGKYPSHSLGSIFIGRKTSFYRPSIHTHTCDVMHEHEHTMYTRHSMRSVFLSDQCSALIDCLNTTNLTIIVSWNPIAYDRTTATHIVHR